MIREGSKKVLSALLFLLWGCLTANCQSSADIDKVLSQLDNGSVKNNVYENKLLGVRVPFPKSIKPDSRETLAADAKDGIELIKSDKPADKRLLDEMISKDRIVLSLDLLESEDSVGAGLNLTIKKDETNEPIGPMADRTIQLLTSNGKQKLAEPIKETSLSNVKFHTFSLSMAIESGSVVSKQYVTRRNGYLLTFSISYFDEKGLSEMESVMKGIEFF